MLPRTEPGRIVEFDVDVGAVELASGKRVKFECEGWDTRFRDGARVIVTFGTKGKVMRVGLDFSAIGLTEHEASNIANVEARFEELMQSGRGITAEQREAFEAALEVPWGGTSKAIRKLRDRITRTLAGDTLPLTDDDPWAAAARAELAKIAERDAWVALLALEGDGSKPTKKWLAAARAEVERIGIARFVETVRRWFALVAPRPVVRDEGDWYAPAMGDANADALRNLVWACSTIEDPRTSEQVAVAVGDLAVRCFTKIRGVGALCMKAGNACIYVLSQLPGMRAVTQLSRLGSRVRYKQALALVDKAQKECARRAGMSPIDLEEISLPAFGLDVEGRARIEIGDYTAELAVVDDKATLAFLEGNRRLKAVPAAVKSEHAEELAELKATHKELAALVPTVRGRLERWMFEPRSWTLADLRARYLDHPLVARLARRLIYTAGAKSVIFFDGFPVDHSGKEVALDDDAELALWHPLERPRKEIDAWRAFLASIDVVQPFKQVDRELYDVADEAKSKVSRRFAGRVVRQHQLAALLRERGWAYSLMGAFDGANSPTKILPAYDLTVMFELEEIETTVAGSGIYMEVATGGVHFLRGERALKLGDVPARCFSEVMRDIDLFVTGAARKAGA